MHEPAVAGLLRAEQGVGGGGKWRRRRPRWLVAEKVFLNLEWRASQVRPLAFPLPCLSLLSATLPPLPPPLPPPLACPLPRLSSIRRCSRRRSSCIGMQPCLAQLAALSHTPLPRTTGVFSG